MGSLAEAEGKRTRPVERSGPVPPPRARYAAMSFASLFGGRAGDGDVARKSIKFAASLSVGAARGVVCKRGPPRPGGGGVCVRLIRGSDARLEVEVDAAEGWP